MTPRPLGMSTANQIRRCSRLTHLRSFYEGKKIAYVYRGQKEIRGTKIRVIWGKVTRPHGMLANCFWYTMHQSTNTR
jgi:hypothetical protein